MFWQGKRVDAKAMVRLSKLKDTHCRSCPGRKDSSLSANGKITKGLRAALDIGDHVGNNASVAELLYESWHFIVVRSHQRIRANFLVVQDRVR